MHKLWRLTPALLAPAILTVVAASRAPDIHSEWTKYVGAGGDTVKAYLAYPERADPAPAVIVIHEIFGMSDWIKSVRTRDVPEQADKAVNDILQFFGDRSGK